VETIGDSYVAVMGLPIPRKQHAVAMARFALDCRDKMRELSRELERTLGPVSCDL
jgi:class 3 adenylate cyclase